jgi:hypothetical protein
LLGASAGRLASGPSAPTARGGVQVKKHFTISSAQDLQAVVREVERFMWRMESEQRALLSD